MIRRLLAAVPDWLADRWDDAFEIDGAEGEGRTVEFTDKPTLWFVPNDALDPDAPTRAEIEAGHELTDVLHFEADDGREWPELGDRGWIVTDDGYYPVEVTDVQPDPEGVRFTIESAQEDE